LAVVFHEAIKVLAVDRMGQKHYRITGRFRFSPRRDVALGIPAVISAKEKL